MTTKNKANARTVHFKLGGSGHHDGSGRSETTPVKQHKLDSHGMLIASSNIHGDYNDEYGESDAYDTKTHTSKCRAHVVSAAPLFEPMQAHEWHTTVTSMTIALIGVNLASML